MNPNKKGKFQELIKSYRLRRQNKKKQSNSNEKIKEQNVSYETTNSQTNYFNRPLPFSRKGIRTHSTSNSKTSSSILNKNKLDRTHRNFTPPKGTSINQSQNTLDNYLLKPGPTVTITSINFSFITTKLHIQKIKHQSLSGSVSKKEKAQKKGFNKNTTDSKKIEELKEKIETRLIKNLEDHKDELDIIESKIFLLKLKAKDELTQDECQELLDKIEELLQKISHLQQQLKLVDNCFDNYNIIEFDDKFIYEDITALKQELTDKIDQENLVGQYKALDIYIYLYRELNEIEEQIIAFQKDEEDKLEMFQIRDQYFEELEYQNQYFESIANRVENDLSEQSDTITKLDSVIDKINQEENITYRLRGIDHLFSTTMRYLGTLLVAPFTGTISGLTIATMATHRYLNHIMQGFHIDTIKNITYNATNYQYNIAQSLNNIDILKNELTSTSDAIQLIKKHIETEYAETSSNLLEYKETMKKINQIEKIIYHNQRKANKLEQKLHQQSNINNDKLKRLHKLNDH